MSTQSYGWEDNGGVCCTSDVGWATPYIGILGTRLKLTAFISFTVLRTSRARHSSATWADMHVSRHIQRIKSADDCVTVWEDDERSENVASFYQHYKNHVWTCERWECNSILHDVGSVSHHSQKIRIEMMMMMTAAILWLSHQDASSSGDQLGRRRQLRQVHAGKQPVQARVAAHPLAEVGHEGKRILQKSNT